MESNYLVVFSLIAGNDETVVTDKVTAASPRDVISSLREQYGTELRRVATIAGLKQLGNKNLWALV